MALTFDDGPSEVTRELGAELAARDARATFFVVGAHIEGRAAELRALVDQRHEIGNHSLHHARTTPRPLHAVRAANARIRAATGVRPTLYRPPYGRAPLALRLAARMAGLTTVGWDVDPRDWEATDPAIVTRHVLAKVQPGSIVVLHERAGERGALLVEAVRGVLAGLHERGYRCVTCSELLGREL
ncbi:MAG: peptidoglycan-N-acetylglucosamine deacetylase [Thermoleophilaceae bacterium]|nr:peptidoglycan-N-acetylglucosamine deacetylase [Thermoleophilaceae bacterium]